MAPRTRVTIGSGVIPALQQLVAVGGKLEQRGHLGVAGQLGVEHGVAAVGLADQEIGAAMELAVEEGGLEDHVGAGTQGINGFPVLGQQGGAVHGRSRDDVVHAASGGRIPVAELLDETVEDLVLVTVAQHGGVLEHLVVVEDGLGGAAQLLVELPEQLVLTAGRDDEVARGKDQVLCGTRHFRFKKKHCAPDAYCRVEGSAAWDVQSAQPRRMFFKLSKPSDNPATTRGRNGLVLVGGPAYGLRTMTEQQPYELVQRFAHFELRRYPAYVVAEIAGQHDV